MTFLDAKNTLCSLKLNISYANVLAAKNSLFSVQDIEDALNAGIRKAWDYKLWPFSEIEATKTGSAGAGNIITIPQSDFEGLQAYSSFLAVVNDVPWIGESAGKRNFPDFMKWMADYPTDNSKIWAEFGENFYFNALAFTQVASYEIDLYGKEHSPSYNTGTDTFDDSSALPFTLEDSGTDTDSSGNEAIILFAYAYLLSSEKKKNPAQAVTEEKKAYTILDTLWAMISEGKAQNNPQNRPMFNTDDYFARSNRLTRYDTNIGNFP